MNRVLSALANVVSEEPVRVIQLGVAVGALLAFAGVDETLLGLVGAVLAALLEVVRRVVAPLAHVADTTVAAAREAATETANAIEDGQAGAAGTVSQAGRTIASLAASGASHHALAALGVPRKVRMKAVTR